jgi:predicted ATPase
MGEIQEIMRQFDHGNGEWQQFIKSIKINNIHGWTDQEMLFKFPVVAVVGENGIGKSTFLKAAVCAYDNKDAKNFYPSNMFMSTQWDTEAMAGATIEYKVRQGAQEKLLKWRKTNDWGFTPRKGKPQRKVFFLDISRTLPLDATAGYAKIAKIASEEMGNEIELDDESIKNLSYVLGQNYARARFVGTNINASREVGLLTKEYGEISQFHQGAGEDTILDSFKLLQTIPNQSLLVIDEVENSLHPQAQRRFVQYLLKLARIKKLQIILSTHSPFVLEELPEIARIMLVRLSDRKDIMYEVSSQFALSTIDDKAHPELYAFLEDEEAVSLFWEILKHDSARYDEFCKKISARPVGSCSVVGTLNELEKNHKLPYSSLAIVDVDKRGMYPNCLSLPGDLAPEKQVITDLKSIGWNRLDERFGIGAGTLFKHLDDAILLPDHHEWTTYIGDHVKKSKDAVWSILIEEWLKQCLNEDVATAFIEDVYTALHP